MKNKEILIIFIFAAISTFLGLFIVRQEGIFSPPTMPGRTAPYPVLLTKRGFPLTWFVEWPLKDIIYISLLFNFLFWFLVIFEVWKVTKYIKRKLSKPDKI